MLNDLVQGFLSGFLSSYPIEERRHFMRVRYRAAVYCLAGKKVTEATVSDIGPQGLCLQSVKRLSRGKKMFLIYRGVPGGKISRLPHKTLKDVASKLPCRVIWCLKRTDAYEVGVRFEAEGEALQETWAKIVVDDIISKQGSLQEKRRHVRARACVNAELKCQGETIVGLLTNVGLGGGMFQSSKHFAAGQGVNLTVKSHPKLPVLKLNGQIVSHSFDVVTNSGLHNIRFQGIDAENTKILKRYIAFFLRSEGSG